MNLRHCHFIADAEEIIAGVDARNTATELGTELSKLVMGRKTALRRQIVNETW
jgi:hypothetical protein